MLAITTARLLPGSPIHRPLIGRPIVAALAAAVLQLQSNLLGSGAEQSCQTKWQSGMTLGAHMPSCCQRELVRIVVCQNGATASVL